MCTSNGDPRDSPAPASSINVKLLAAHSISHQCVQGATTWGSRAGLPFLSQGKWAVNSNVQQQNQLSYTSGKQRSKVTTTSLFLQTPLSLNDIMTTKQPVGDRQGQNICHLAFLPLIFLEDQQQLYPSNTLWLLNTGQTLLTTVLMIFFIV